MPNPRAGTHVLQVPRLYDRAVLETVLMLQLSRDDVSEDFHVAMGMEREASHRVDLIVVHDSKGLESHLLRIEVIGKRAGKPGEKPAVVG